MKKSLFTVFTCVLGFAGIAQQAPRQGFDPKYSLQDLALDVWDNNDGLVSNNVNALFQSSDHYIWISSYNGLQKFDGDKIDVFDQTLLPFLSSNAVNQITESIDGRLIISTQSDGVFEYYKGDFSPLSINASIPNSVSSVLSDTKGILWLGTTNNGLYRSEVQGRVTKENTVPNVTIHSLMEGQSGDMWMATDGHGVFRMMDGQVENFTLKSGLASNITMALAQNTEGQVFVGSIDGLSIFDGTRMRSVPSLRGWIINDILVDDFGTLWLGTDRGLIRYHLKEDRLEVFDEADGLPGNRVTSLLLDHEGSLWIGTYETGLARFKLGMISNLTIRDGLSTNQIYCVNKNGSAYYIGTQDGRINIFENGAFSTLTFDSQFRKDVIRDIRFYEGEIWVGNYMGLAKITPQGTQYFNEQNGKLPNNSVRRIFKDSRGSMWLATRAGGLVRFSESGDHEVFDKNKGLLTNYVLALAEDRNGNILIGTNAGGLSVLSPDGVIRNFNLVGDDSGTIIFSIRVTADGSAWLATNLGLFQFKNNQLRQIRLEGLSMQKFFDVVHDDAGSIWLTSSIGVIEVAQEDMHKFLEGQTSELAFEVFGEEDGMESQECTGATIAYFDEDTGNLWIPTYEGVSVIKPWLKTKNKKVPKVFITGMQVDNNRLHTSGDNLVIQPGNFRYQFHITALSFLAPSKVQFKYKLVGIENEWNGPINERKIEYTNLPYGNYELHVIASNNDGVWNEQGARLKFEIQPFYFETWWFKIGLALVLFGSIYAFYRWRIREVRHNNKVLSKMNAELDRFVYSASHDLRGPLTTILGVIQMAFSKQPQLKEDQYLRMIKSSADKMDHFIGSLINYAKNKNDIVERNDVSIGKLTDELLAEMEPFRREKNVTIIKTISDDLVVKSDRHRLGVILKNLIHNAISFSGASESNPSVWISATATSDGFKLEVRDNGEGISPKIKDRIFDMFYRGSHESQGSGLGLYVTRDTCEKLGGKLSVQSKPGEGATFTVHFPK